MSNVIGAVKLRNAIKRIAPELTIQLKNVRVNGAHFGCEGFVSDLASDRHVYVSTDHNHHTNSTGFFRRAASTSDYRGFENHFAKLDAEVLAQGVVRLVRGEVIPTKFSL